MTIADDPTLCGGVSQPPCGSGASASAVMGDAAVTGFTSLDGGADYSAPIVTITDNPALCGGASQPACGTGATADATIGGTLTGGIRKFVDDLPGLGPGGANNLVTLNRLGAGPASAGGQYIPVAVPEQVTFSNQAADYYVIGLVEFNERMHSDLPPTRHRGYVQLETATKLPQPRFGSRTSTAPPSTIPDGRRSWLSITRISWDATIVAGRDKPVRVKFYNLLPTGTGETSSCRWTKPLRVPGRTGRAGYGGPEVHTKPRHRPPPRQQHRLDQRRQRPTSGSLLPAKAPPIPRASACGTFRTCRDAGGATAHDHFLHQRESARLMFYHDHALGITRLNVYAGEAAGYVLTDPVEQDMINGTNLTGVNPGRASRSPP